MKNLIVICTFLFACITLNAQTDVFVENFESSILKVTSSSNNSSTQWARSSALSSEGQYSDTATIKAAGDTVMLTTNSVNLNNNKYGLLTFSHICKAEFGDGGYLEVNNGTGWVRLTGEEYISYGGQFGEIDNRFSAGSYVDDWQASNNMAVPNNTWWKKETFDISKYVNNKTTLQIRFVLYDGNSNGSLFCYGWLLDDIKVTLSNTDNVPPSLNLYKPYPVGSVYSTGQWDLLAKVKAKDGIEKVEIVYEVLGDKDTALMTKMSDTTFSGNIPSHSYGTTISYYVVATDSSGNTGRYPTLTPFQFTNSRDPNLPPAKRYDVAMDSIISPLPKVLSNTKFPVDIRFQSFGSEDVKKVSIGYTIDGNIKPYHIWTGNITTDMKTRVFNIDTFSMPGGPHQLSVWTSSPNDTVDLNPDNDVFTMDFYSCDYFLDGEYTLGAAGSHFSNFAELTAILENCGLRGPTTIKVQPGTYSERMVFTDKIIGISNTNTLTIESATGNPDDVIFQISSGNILSFSGSDYVTVRNVTLKATSASGYSIVRFSDKAKNNTIDGCKVILPYITEHKQLIGIEFIGGNNNSNKIINNYIYGGCYAIYGLTSASFPNFRTEIHNNEFIDAFRTGVELNYSYKLNVTNNYFNRKSNTKNTYSNANAYNFEYCDEINFQRNKSIIDVEAASYGIYFYKCIGTSENSCKVINNILIIKGLATSNTLSALYLRSNENMDIVNNTFIVHTGMPMTTVVYTVDKSIAINFVNNVVANYAKNYTFKEYQTAVNIFAERNFNAYYTNGTIMMDVLGTKVPTSGGISEIQMNTGKDSASIVADPMPYSIDDARIYSPNLAAAGTPFPGVTHDIEGKLRSTTKPSIGAYEFSYIDKDIAVLEILKPAEIDTQNRRVAPLVVLKNVGDKTINSIDISYVIDNGTPTTYKWTGVLTSSQTDTFELDTLSIPVMYYDMKVYTSVTGDVNKYNDTLTESFYGLPLVDLELQNINAPFSGCEKTSNEQIQVLIKNKGVQDVDSGITAYIKFNGSTQPVIEKINASIKAKSSIVYTFNHTIDLSVGLADETFSLMVAVNHQEDKNNYNDTVSKELLSKAAISSPVATDQTIGYSDSAVLTATSDYVVEWFADSASNVSLGLGKYTTPNLFDTTTYWVRSTANLPNRTTNVGDGTGAVDDKYYSFYSGNRQHGKFQILYRAEELKDAGVLPGVIDYVAFYAGASFSAPSFTSIKVGLTTVDSLNVNFETTYMKEVFSGTYSGKSGWNYHYFGTEFRWDGKSNILFEVCAESIEYAASKQRYTPTSYPSYNAKVIFGDPSGVCDLKNSSKVSNQRPNIRIKTNAEFGCHSPKYPSVVNVIIPSIEAKILEIVNPIGGCGIETSEVEVRLTNVGKNPLPVGTELSYKINNGSFFTPFEKTTKAINRGDTTIFKFATKANLPAGPEGKKYVISAVVKAAGDAYTYNDEVESDSIYSRYTPVKPSVVSPISINYADSALLTATAIDSVFWYLDANGNSFSGMGNPYTTANLFENTSYWGRTQKYISDSVYKIGSGTTVSGTSGGSPYGSNLKATKIQFMYRADELTAMGVNQGDISAISFKVYTVSGLILNDFTISIASTKENDLNRGTFIPNLKTVVGPKSYIESYDWNEHTFDIPYNWDGESNLVIQTYMKGTEYVSFASVEVSNTSWVSTAQTTGSGSFSPDISNIGSYFTTRPNILIRNTGLGHCKSVLEKIDVNIKSFPKVDIGVVSLNNPTLNASKCAGEDVKFEIKNYGTDNLKSATITWSENGVLQKSFAWTGDLAQGETEVVTVANSHIFSGGTTYIKAWTTATGDNVAINDTLEDVVKVSLTGNYTIGTKGRDYKTFSDAVTDLIDCGVCGSVVFNVDSGSYNERLIIKKIGGTSATNTITFQSASKDSNDVVLMANTTQPLNFVVLIDAADNLHFKHINFGANGSDYGNVFSLKNGANNIKFESNIINSTLSSKSQYIASGIALEQSYGNDIIVHNNKFIGGYSCIKFYAPNYGDIKNITITDNEILDFNKYGVHNYGVDFCIINNNNISSSTTSPIGIDHQKSINGFQICNNKFVLKATSGIAAINLYCDKEDGSYRPLIANNMFSLLGGNQWVSAVKCGRTNYIDIVYNSVYANGGNPSQVEIFSILFPREVNFSNNNIHSVEGVAMTTNTTQGFDLMDYNNYYLPNSQFLFMWEQSGVPDLAAAIQLDPAHNKNSTTVDPYFVSEEDLHSEQISLYNAGKHFKRVLTDFDNETRKATPSIGADEFTPHNIDLLIDEMVYPFENNCSFTSTEKIEVIIRNAGLNDINFSTSPATIDVDVKGKTLKNYSIQLNTGIFKSGESKTVVVTTACDLSDNSIYELNAKITVAGDGNVDNNALPTVKFVSLPTINTFPFKESFESGDNITFNTSKGTESDIGVSQFAANYSSFGLHFQGGTSLSWTHPTDVTTAYNNSPSHVIKAFTCDVDATNETNLNLKFDLKQTAYDLNNFDRGSWFRVILTDANGDHYLKNAFGDSVFKPKTFNYDKFVNHVFRLDEYLGQRFTISLEACCRMAYGSGDFDGDNAFVDNIAIVVPSPKDLGVNKIFSGENFGKVGSYSKITVEIENYGYDTLENIPLAYSTSKGIIRDTLFKKLPPFAIDTFVFSKELKLVEGNTNVTVFGEYPQDMFAENDTASLIFKGLKTFFPNYEDDFEKESDWIAYGSFDQWELGAPSTANINKVPSGSNAWVTVLDDNYISSADEFLISPYFTILPYTDSITLEFTHMMRTFSGKAFGTIEYSFDGKNWASIGYKGIPASEAGNWYNVKPNGQDMWGMLSPTWITSWIKLDPATFNTGKTVQFRFFFNSHSSNSVEEGWAIDDFKLYFPAQKLDAGVVGISVPRDSVELGSSHAVKISIKNFGTDTLYNMPVSYSVNGTEIANEVYMGTILPNEVVEHTFASAYSFNEKNTVICSKTNLSGDMQMVNNEFCKTLVVTSANMDAGINEITAPFGMTTSYEDVNVEMYIVNFGVQPITKVDVEYFVTGNSIKNRETYNGNIAPNDSVLYKFTQPFTSPNGYYQLVVLTDLAGDGYSGNDTAKIALLGSGLGDIERDRFAVAQNQPNPTKNNTVIEYYLPKKGQVKLSLVNVLGEEIYSESIDKTYGKHLWELDSRTLEAGIYYYTITFEEESITRKMAIIR